MPIILKELYLISKMLMSYKSDLDPLSSSLKDLLQISVVSEISADGFGLSVVWGF